MVRTEPASDRLVEGGMPGVEQSIEVASPPAGDQVGPDVEATCDGPDRPDRERVEMPALETRDGRAGDARSDGQVDLSPASPQPHSSYRRAKPVVVHLRECRQSPLPPDWLAARLVCGPGPDPDPGRAAGSLARFPPTGPWAFGWGGTRSNSGCERDSISGFDGAPCLARRRPVTPSHGGQAQRPVHGNLAVRRAAPP